MLKVLSQTLIVIVLAFLWFPEAFGQPVFPSDLKKPKKYENKLLGAEKSADKKFSKPRRFIQNTITHYNWYFNANNKLNAVLERAKLSHKDDFAELLSFYNYTLEKTAADKTELDSVVIRSNAGILTHDLRNDWIDNMYMLMGKAYYFRNDLDSAYLSFQYINYAFSPKEKDGYDIPIGSNSFEGGSALSVSTKENNSLVKRAMSTPPSRNESFIWQIRTYIEKKEMTEAASLIETLKNDNLFPERLSADLNEVQALWFYKKNMYDSSAIYLEKALGNAASRQETSRWEFLIAQLYALAKQPDQSIAFYNRAIKHTLDPVLEVYARLNSIRQNTGDSNAINRNIEDLKKMGRRDLYSKYRDIIYYTAAQIELDRNNVPAARAFLIKSTQAATMDNDNLAQRTKSFLLLGDLSFRERLFYDAKRFYDSINSNDPGIKDPQAFLEKKDLLQEIVLKTDIMHRQDSLQNLAAMPEAQRQALLKKMVRQLRRKQGLKEEEESGNAATGLGQNNKQAPDLFQSADNNKGDWYFNNPALKSKGFTAFKSTWGNRPNVDNWRRASSVSQANIAAKQAAGRAAANDGTSGEPEDGEISYEALLKNIPLTDEQMSKSKDSVENALLDLGIILVNKLEDYPVAIDTLEKFVNNFIYSSRMPEALYYLNYAYTRTGNTAKAQQVQQDMNNKFQGTEFQKKLHNAITGEDEKANAVVTKTYENIYNLFIEGDFDQALAQKKIADSIYGSTYWTPQLLYIESVYHLHERKDDQAKKSLQQIIDLYPDQPMANKAKLILEVLGRRKEIEDYLTKLEITRVEDSVYVINDVKKPLFEKVGTPMIQDSTTIQPIKVRQLIIDTVKTGKPVVNMPNLVIKKDSAVAEPAANNYTFHVEAAHAVVILLNKVDPVYVTESRNAFNRYNKEKYYNKTIEINNLPLNDSLKLVVMTGFENAAVALEYMEKTQKIAATQIVPWLPAPKYSFMIISEDNIEVLKSRQDMNEYLKFFERYKK